SDETRGYRASGSVPEQCDETRTAGSILVSGRCTAILPSCRIRAESSLVLLRSTREGIPARCEDEQLLGGPSGTGYPPSGCLQPGLYSYVHRLFLFIRRSSEQGIYRCIGESHL